MRNLKRSDLEKDLTRYIGRGTKLKFLNDKNWYLFKNFTPDYKSLFVTLVGERVYRKRVVDIIEVHNGELLKIEECIMEENLDKEKDLEKGIKVEREHKPTYDRIRRFYDKFKKLPSKEEFYKWIATDHENEFPEEEYYKALEQMEEELKKKNIIKEDMFDNDFVPSLQEADEEPVEVTNEERLTEVIDVRVGLEGIANTIENLLLVKEEIALIPIKINTAVRLQNILGAIKKLRNDLDSYSVITESEDLLSNTEEEQEAREDERDREEERQEILYGSVSFEKKDVEIILENNYKVLSRDKNLWKIAVRNPFRESKSDLYNYNLEVFFDKNSLDVTPTHLTESTEKLTNKILKEIYEDLQAIKDNSSIVNEEQEEVIQEPYDKASSEYIVNVVRQEVLNTTKTIQVTDKEVEVNKVKGDKYREAEVVISFFTEPTDVEGYKFSDLLITLEVEYDYNVSVSPGDEITPEYTTDSIDVTKVVVTEVYVDGDPVNLSSEIKSFIDNIDWGTYIEELDLDELKR